jgi:hypothetical protein
VNLEITHLLRVIAVVTLLLSSLVLLTGRLKSFRHEEALDFRSLQKDEVVIDFMLTRYQIGSLRLGYLEKYGVRPEIGIFGNHQIQLLASEALRQTKDSGVFFNYWYSNLALPELRDELYYLSTKDLLPTKLALVQITTPNNDNGWHIVNYGNELPIDIRLFAASEYAPNLWSLLSTYFQNLREGLYSRLRWDNIVRSLYRENRYWVLDPSSCNDVEEEQRSWFHKTFPQRTIRYTTSYHSKAELCKRTSWSLMRDGSAHPLRIESVRGTLRKNEIRLSEDLAGLTFGDEKVIQRYMRQIVEAGSKNGAQVVFVILPVYESHDRSNTTINKIMDKALSGVPDIPVIDHRREFFGPEYFSNYDHPNAHYFETVLSPELCQRYLQGC